MRTRFRKCSTSRAARRDWTGMALSCPPPAFAGRRGRSWRCAYDDLACIFYSCRVARATRPRSQKNHAVAVGFVSPADFLRTSSKNQIENRDRKNKQPGSSRASPGRAAVLRRPNSPASANPFFFCAFCAADEFSTRNISARKRKKIPAKDTPIAVTERLQLAFQQVTLPFRCRAGICASDKLGENPFFPIMGPRRSTALPRRCGVTGPPFQWPS